MMENFIVSLANKDKSFRITFSYNILMVDIKALHKFILWFVIFDASMFLLSFFLIADTVNLSISYEIEQFWWFLMGTTFLGIYISLIVLISEDYKKNRHILIQTENPKRIIDKLRLNWQIFFHIGVFLLILVTLIYIYSKSFLPMREFELFITLTNPIGFLPYSLLWIGIFFLAFSFILASKFLPKNK